MARDALIKVRRDTAANWTSVNPTLASGEVGFETDTRKAKIGDGSTAWTSLSYAFPGTAQSATDTAFTPNGDIAATNVQTAIQEVRDDTDTKLASNSTGDRARANHTGTQTASTISDFNSASDARISNAVGGTVQGYDADLQAIATLSPTNDDIIQRKSGAWTNRTPAQLKTDLALTKSDVGLSNVDNTSDANKPVSTATQTALDGKVDENSAITGATKTKITYDSKGLVTAGADATQDDIVDGATYKQYSATEKTKLAGIATGATANDTDANLKNRANHTGTQTASTISDFNTAADARVSAAIGVTVQGYDADLNTIAGLTATTDNFMVATASAWASRTPSQARTQMGLGSLATLSTVGTSQIDNDAVTYAKIQNVSTTSRVLGRITAGAGDVEELTAANLKTILALTASDVGLGNVTNNVQYYAGGTDVAVVDGGTGSSTASGARANLGVAASGANTDITSLTSVAVLGLKVAILTDGATVNTNAALGNIFDLTMAGDRTIANPTNPVDGQRILYRLRQDATGTRIPTWGANFRFSADIPQPVLSTTANKLDRIAFEYTSADTKWDCIGVSRGY